MSKLLSLFNRQGGASGQGVDNSTLDQTARILERNRRFEFFLMQRQSELENDLAAEAPLDRGESDDLLAMPIWQSDPAPADIPEISPDSGSGEITPEEDDDMASLLVGFDDDLASMFRSQISRHPLARFWIRLPPLLSSRLMRQPGLLVQRQINRPLRPISRRP
jgi:hypothetical protein